MHQLYAQATIEALERVAIDAGSLIRRLHTGDLAVARKADGSPVTAADKAAERMILQALATIAPGVPVVAEDSVADGLIGDISAEDFFLVDPLDGTREYVGGRTDYTVNIAFVAAGVPVFGIVVAPEHDTAYTAIAGAAQRLTLGPDGAITRRDDIRARKPGADILALVSVSHLDGRTVDFLDQHRVTSRMKVGSSLKFCRIASGEADLYPRLGRTMQWDTAAGDAVLRAAGGMTCGRDGAPLRYGQSASLPSSPDLFANAPFIAFGTWTEEQRDGYVLPADETEGRRE